MAIISPLPVTLANGTANDANQVMQDFNQIVSNVNTNGLARDGSVVNNANQNFGGFKLTNLGAAAAVSDAVRLDQVTTKLDQYSAAPALTSLSLADMLSVYDNANALYKRITVANARLALSPFASTGFHVVASANPVAAGLNGSTTFNSMKGQVNASKVFDNGNLVVNWVLTPGVAGLQLWQLNAYVKITHATGFPASTVIQMSIVRFTAADAASSRYTFEQQADVATLTAVTASGTIFAAINSATDYFTVETLMSTAGVYDVNDLNFSGFRVA